ncbi:MAG TPA: RidA family protein [Micromonosporaceae bacterium]|jgi:enamine deaminase RidA (YjgF/YER057c/UK114 family)
MDREAIIRNADTYDTWHFAEANRVGRTVWVAAQRGFDERDQISRDPTIQARVAFRQLERTLGEAGATMDDIVSLTSYHTDMAHLETFRAVKDEFVRAPYPAWTIVGVAALASPDMLVEIAAIAVVGSGRRPTEHRLMR